MTGFEIFVNKRSRATEMINNIGFPQRVYMQV